ncbi:hypothetical protein [Simiduia agarivorans]|uniref:Succinylglutamate desuccinylase/aspartoacylase n=1 Tax=Simiduia agarivorans (strain DSM 21679 / JCM 13881 / BCRC 17597 / SA1) TaxID=1117647 RepID=K4KM87_SIMAS|nr:hypothetical protein [Simiduia agarivorans]AFV00285.1 hypothetical protein M5M_15760 [Simiduia agarivorans SA1 = DSM 21679]
MLPVIDASTLQVPADAGQFLHSLGGAVAIEHRVDDTLPWCVVSVLVHGNEPSGFFACHQLLKAGFKPAWNTAWVISSVRAARTAPEFTHRHLPGEYDLNRRFGVHPIDDPVTALAFDMTDYIRERQPRWVLDIHNTSGRGPAFGVAVANSQAIASLLAPFTDRLIVTHLVVGSLMEQNFNCPVVTLECGGSADPAAHSCAVLGLRQLLASPALSASPSQLTLYQHPVRVQLRAGLSLAYGDSACPGAVLTLRSDLEQLNCVTAHPGTCFGWLQSPLADALSAVNDQRQDVIEQLFEVDKGVLQNRVPMQVFMATPRADIALSDCLFYAA